MRPDGALVCKLRSEHGWDQEELARRCYRSKHTIINVEQGRKVTLDTLKDVATALDVSALHLLARNGQTSFGIGLMSLPEEAADSTSPLPFALYRCARPSLAADLVATILALLVNRQFGTSILLPTGRTALTLFDGIVRSAASLVPERWASAHVFADTETYGVTPDHPTSRVRAVQTHLLDRLCRTGLPTPHTYFLRGYDGPEDDLMSIDLALAAHAPDIYISAASPHGEVCGFEADSPTPLNEMLSSRTSIRNVSRDAAIYIDNRQKVYAIKSIGIGNAMTCGILLLVLLNATKAIVLDRLLREPTSPKFPVSIYKQHRRLVVVADADACGANAVTAEVVSESQLPTVAATILRSC